VIFGELGQVERAQQYYEMALQYNSSLVEAHVNIGVIHKQRGELEAAIACYERALQLHPNFTLASMNLSVALNDYATSIKMESPSRFKEAVRLYKRALYHNSKYADAWYNLGVAYGESNRPERAAVCYEIAFHLNPQCAEALNNLGVLAKDKDNLERALQYYLQAVAINPRYPQPLNNMGVIYTIQGKLQEAKEVLLRAVELFNEYAEAWNNLGVLARDEGQMDLAHEYYARSLRYDPNARNTQHNLLMALNYLPDYPLQRMFEEHRDWGLRFQSLVTPLNEQDLPAAKDRDPERPLRVGYISPDFITHSVSYFIEAPLAYHRSGREVQAFCYSNAPREDQKSEHLRRLAHQWRQVHGKPASEVAAQIVADCIDILVELAGHTAGNRLDVCALCPAPLQITYLGYPNTSGLPTIHYRITDARADPPDTQQKFVEEVLILLDIDFVCICVCVCVCFFLVCFSSISRSPAASS
jgi:predicted O-linked N-acetylglucosamine transferase (SPINDLY family)